MFTNSITDSSALTAAAFIGVLAYWRLLGGALDSRVFVALNFSLITLWALSATRLPLLRLGAVAFMALMLLSYRMYSNKRMHRRIDSALDVDMSPLLVALSLIALITNVQAGSLTLIDARALVLEQREESALAKYSTYLLLSASWVTVHVICRAATQRRWTRLQLGALALAVMASATSLSKASFLPILLTLLFVYSKRLGYLRLTLIASAGFGLTILLIQRLFDGLSVPEITQVLLARVLQNVDILDYIEGVGDVATDYPNASPCYLIWPIFQFTQREFIAVGVWIHGTMRGDWRGFGPNPTFVGDMVLASQYVGLLVAPFLGALLRASDRSRFRVFISMACYIFLQDWYFGCISAAGFFLLLMLSKRMKVPRPRQRPRANRHRHEDSHPRPALQAPQ